MANTCNRSPTKQDPAPPPEGMLDVQDAAGQDKPAARRISKWVPVAAFVGTSIALAVPLVFVARQRTKLTRVSLKNTAAPPPRRASHGVVQFPRTTAAPAADMSEIKLASSDETSPGSGQFMTALSKLDSSTAVFAGKAFGIATCLVTVGAALLVYGVKTTMDVQDTSEFARKVRLAIWKRMPGLTAQIHRDPVDESGKPIVYNSEVDLEWKWEDAEKRLRDAYDKGGFAVWAQTALLEMEAELKVERARRRREVQESTKTDTVS